MINTLTRLLVLALAAFASGDLRPAIAFVATAQGSGPVAGPVEVFTDAHVLSAPFGSLLDTSLLVTNDGAVPAKVFLLGQITWPDGTTQILDYGPSFVIEADGGLVLSALSPIPSDVGSGEGTFTVHAFVGAIGPGEHAHFPSRFMVEDSSPFALP